jgi:DNA-directed RNA polymerase specialized sigma24 family protein
MKEKGFYAVITGDIVGSTKFTIKQRSDLLVLIKESFATIKQIFPGIIHAPFEIHRGDSFQGVLSKPEKALAAAIIIRTTLRYRFKTKRLRKALDTRIAVGIGSIDFLPGGRGTEGDGEAFRLSGPILDEMKGDQRLLIRTRSDRINAELDSECALLDALINRWSSEQAQAVQYQIRGLTQKKAAMEMGISQPAVRLRLQSAGGWAIEELLARYNQIICQIISPGAYNGGI